MVDPKPVLPIFFSLFCRYAKVPSSLKTFFYIALFFAAATAMAAFDISPTELENGIRENLMKTSQFAFIREESKKLGIKVYLFGGTAAAYAHYVKWDMQREKGDTRFQDNRFDYDYTNIFRSTQDLDIVVDGDAKKAKILQNILMEKYPQFLGERASWEVRPLRETIDNKTPILDDFDFQNQHTDSNSTGTIEISDPGKKKPIVRDVRDWDSKNPNFLRDVASDEIHFYYSPTHQKTTLAKLGKNPSIVSVVRLLTKVFQYEVKLKNDQLPIIRKIIAEFDPTKIDPLARQWLEKHAKKLFLNAVNLDYAARTLDELGLREKLIRAGGNKENIDSMAWHLNRKPLEEKPLGVGYDPTAQEYFKGKNFTRIDGNIVLAHETKNFLAYESITRAHTGAPNVFTSRWNSPGETAALGEGFYTRLGTEGAKGTGWTIRFVLNPKARLNVDFTIQGDYVVVKNKSAITVIPESLHLTPLEFFQMLEKEGKLEKSNRGIWEKTKLRMAIHLKSNIAEMNEIAKNVKNNLASEKINQTLIQEWIALPGSEKHTDITKQFLDILMAKSNSGLDRNLTLFEFRHLEASPELFLHFLENMDFSKASFWEDRLRDLFSKDAVTKIDLFSKKFGDLKFLKKLAKRDTNTSRFILENVLTSNLWESKPKQVLELLPLLDEYDAIKHWFSQEGWWQKHPEFVDYFIARGDRAPAMLCEYALNRENWKTNPNWNSWINQLVKQKDPDIDKALAKYVLTDPNIPGIEKWVKILIQRGAATEALAAKLFSHSDAKTLAPYLQKLVDHYEGSTTANQYLNQMLSNPIWQKETNIQFPSPKIDALLKSIRHVYGTTETAHIWLSHSMDLRKNEELFLALLQTIKTFNGESYNRKDFEAATKSMELFDPKLFLKNEEWMSIFPKIPQLKELFENRMAERNQYLRVKYFGPSDDCQKPFSKLGK